jgi:hypothetical protein
MNENENALERITELERDMKAHLDLILGERARIGAFSRVFLDHENNRAYKLFKSERFGEVFGKQDGERLADADRHAIFQVEVEAFRIANETDELRPYVPKLFGLCSVRSVRDTEGNDLSAAFLLDYCYVLEFLQGDDKKFDDADAKATIGSWHDICAKFARHGINFICDASFFLLPSGEVKLIDIATQDIQGIGAGW